MVDLMKRLWILGVVIFLVMCSCSNKSSEINNKNTLRVDIGMEPPTLDPAKAEDAYAFRVINDLFAGLVDFDQTNKPIPGMAESWDISADGKTYTFHLRNNLKFSDGSPITAHDFVYSWERVVNPKTASPYNFLLKSVVNAENIMNGKMKPDQLGVVAADNNTFIVTLAYPNNSFLSYITVPDVFVVPQNVIKKYGNKWTDPKNIVTSGAYKLKEHVINGHILAVKNPYYYDAGKVSIANVIYFPYTDVNVSLSNFKTGAEDTTWQNVPIDQYADLKNKYPQELHTVQWERLEFLVYNMKLPKYAKNLKLREALSMAIDRNVLVNDILKSGQIPLYSVVTPTIEAGSYAGVKYAWSDWSQQKRLARARALYREAGYSDKNPLTITLKYKTNDLYRKVAVAIASMWNNELGVNVTLQNVEWKTLIQSLHNGDYDISFAGWGADYNSVTTYTPLYICGNPNNYAHYCNDKYDTLIDEADITTSKDQQEQLYKRALDIVLNDYPTVPLFEPSHQRLVSNRVQNYRINENYLDNVQSKWMNLNQN